MQRNTPWFKKTIPILYFHLNSTNSSSSSSSSSVNISWYK